MRVYIIMIVPVVLFVKFFLLFLQKKLKTGGVGREKPCFSFKYAEIPRIYAIINLCVYYVLTDSRPAIVSKSSPVMSCTSRFHSVKSIFNSGYFWSRRLLSLRCSEYLFFLPCSFTGNALFCFSNCNISSGFNFNIYCFPE